MTRFYAFNGDADGLCAQQQLRLREGADGTLVTGTKRDIELLQRVDAAAGDEVTALDISLDRNRAPLLRLLAIGVSVRYFDHHYAGELPAHPHFEPHIEESAEVCTSVLVARYLGEPSNRWAIAAAFGDGLPVVATALARSAALDAATIAVLEELGTLLNYNAYGDSIRDLRVDPAELAREMLPFSDPVDFARRSRAFVALAEGYEDDMRKARALRPVRQVPGATLLMLPDAPWARRSIGVLANELVGAQSGNAIAILAPRTRGGYIVSVRVPPGRSTSAEEFCRGYKTGGGRKLAAGIDHLAQADLDGFMQCFETDFRVER
jgi:hypothetical protein